MSKIKVGDKVRLINDGGWSIDGRFYGNYSGFVTGDTFIVEEIKNDYLRKEKGKYTGVHESSCELVEECPSALEELLESVGHVLINLTDHLEGIMDELDEVQEEEVEVEEGTYRFKDTEIDFRKLCIDALEDDRSSFIVQSKDRAYVGLIQSGKSVGVPTLINDFSYGTGGVMTYVPDLPYGIFEINFYSIDSWRVKLEKYSEDYKEYRSNLDIAVKDRDRKKGILRKDLISFKVKQF